jgi:hypothetical protein
MLLFSQQSYQLNIPLLLTNLKEKKKKRKDVGCVRLMAYGQWKIKSIDRLISSILRKVIVLSIVVSPTETHEFIELGNEHPLVLGSMQPRFRL